MANFAKISFEVNGISDLDSWMVIQFVKSSGLSLSWQCKAVRTTAGQYRQATTNNIEQTYELQLAVSADLANSSISSFMTVSSTGQTSFDVEANQYGWTIEKIGEIGTTNVTTTETPEELPVKDFQLSSYTLLPGTLPCADIELTITENDGVSPYTWVIPSNSSTSLIAQISRGSGTISVTLEDSEADQATLNSIVIPPIFTSVFITDISSVTNVGGLDATVTAFVDNTSGLFTFTYSLDGSLFQSSNVFPNVVDGDYTLYVNDGYGCIVTKTFSVDTSISTQRASAYAIVPNANPLNWVQTGTTQYQTIDNTLYNNLYYEGWHKPKWEQLYQTNDGTIINQFRSNYDELSARMVNCDGDIIETFTIEQKTNNLGATDKRDTIAFNKGSNQTGLYFTSGNIYDPDTDEITDTYELNGQVPEWAVVGNTIILTGSIVGSYLIKQVVYDSSVQARAVIFDYSWTSGNESEAVIVEITYNKKLYEIHEFEIDLSLFDPGIYQAQILMSDSLDEYDSVSWTTDDISIKAEHNRTNFIEYYTSKVSGIDYSTGFIGKIRVKSLDPYLLNDPGIEAEQYSDSRDNTTTIKANSVMGASFYIEEVTGLFKKKLSIIFAHIDLFINGVKWTATEFENLTMQRNYLDNVNVTIKQNEYEEYQTDNIDVDGEKDTIDQETGTILQ